MRSAPLALLVLLIACDRTSDPAISCERTRADAMESCAWERSTMPRASCVQTAREELAECLESVGELDRSAAVRCSAECGFLRVLCEDARATRGIPEDCAADELACEADRGCSAE